MTYSNLMPLILANLTIMPSELSSNPSPSSTFAPAFDLPRTTIRTLYLRRLLTRTKSVVQLDPDRNCKTVKQVSAKLLLLNYKIGKIFIKFAQNISHSLGVREINFLKLIYMIYLSNDVRFPSSAILHISLKLCFSINAQIITLKTAANINND